MMNVEAEWLRHVKEMRIVLLVVGFFPPKNPLFLHLNGAEKLAVI